MLSINIKCITTFANFHSQTLMYVNNGNVVEHAIGGRLLVKKALQDWYKGYQDMIEIINLRRPILPILLVPCILSSMKSIVEKDMSSVT